MKTLIFASVIFTLCIIAVIANCIFIKSEMDSLSAILEERTDGTEQITQKLERFAGEWEKNRFLISLSVSLLEIEEIDRLVARAEEQADVSDIAGCQTTISELREAISDIVRTEKFSLEGML